MAKISSDRNVETLQTRKELTPYRRKSYFSNKYLYGSKLMVVGNVNGFPSIWALVLKDDRTTHKMGKTDMTTVKAIRRYIQNTVSFFIVPSF
jgi:hypothetical protein